MKIFLLYVVTFVCIVLFDIVWFSVSSGFYKKEIGFLFGPSLNYIPALLFYLLYAVGIIFFVVFPLLKGASGGSGAAGLDVGVASAGAFARYSKAFLTGALFGLIAYGTYDLTNHTTINNWPVLVTVVDMLWGGLATGVVSVIVLAVGGVI